MYEHNFVTEIKSNLNDTSTKLTRNLPLIWFFESLFSFSISFLLQWPHKKWWESWGARWKRKLRHKNCILWINRHMGVYIRYGFEQLKVELVCQRTKKMHIIRWKIKFKFWILISSLVDAKLVTPPLKNRSIASVNCINEMQTLIK